MKSVTAKMIINVFEISSKVMIAGSTLEIGKFTENVFGKGTFRKIGELDGDIKEQEKFVRSL